MARRAAILTMAGALFVVLVAGVAMARTFQCGEFAYPCEGTNNPDTITERQGRVQDDISGLGGGDTIRAQVFGRDNDIVQGDKGADRIRTDDGDERDVVDCGENGGDVAVVDEGDAVNFTNCEEVRGQNGEGQPPQKMVPSDPSQDVSRAVVED